MATGTDGNQSDKIIAAQLSRSTAVTNCYGCKKWKSEGDHMYCVPLQMDYPTNEMFDYVYRNTCRGAKAQYT